MHLSVTTTCVASESFARGGPTLTTLLLVDGGGIIQIPLLAGHLRPAIETPFKWRFAGVPMRAQHVRIQDFFSEGVQARLSENSLDNVFFFFCFVFSLLVLNLFYSLQRGSNGYITEKTILF